MCFQMSVAILSNLYLSVLLLARPIFIPAGTLLDAQQRNNNNTNGLFDRGSAHLALRVRSRMLLLRSNMLTVEQRASAEESAFLV